jgi:hypothetical protein
VGENRSQASRRVTVTEAAEALGISVEAMRRGVKRNIVEHEKADDGTVYVLLEAAQSRPVGDRPHDQTTDQGLLVERLDSQIQALRDLCQEVAYLRQLLSETNETNRENRRFMTALTSATPELPPAESKLLQAEQPPLPTEVPADTRDYAVTPTLQPGRKVQAALEGDQEPLEAAQMPAPATALQARSPAQITSERRRRPQSAARGGRG